MAPWGWLVIGFGLMAIELLGLEAAFYLVIIGFAAIVTGLIGLVGLTLPVWGQWVFFSGVAIASMLLFQRKLYARFRVAPEASVNSLVGEIVNLSQDAEPGERCRVELRGSSWIAVNVGPETVAAGAQAEVIDVDGFLLEIESYANA